MTCYLLGIFVLLLWMRVIINGIACNRVVPEVTGLPLPGPDDSLPKLSIVMAARNEETHIRSAVLSLLKQDHPDYELIVVDDRSTDGTPRILAELAGEFPDRLNVQRVDELPEGWLGKCNALSTGAQAAAGEHILFTDADVIFEPTALARTHLHAVREGADQLTVLPEILARRFVEEILFNVFGVCFILSFPPNQAMRRNSGKFFGVGAFNMIRADMYKRIHGHRFLRMLVVDDMGLGRLVKKSGGVVRVAYGHGSIRIPWYDSLGSAVRGLEKNSFAGANYRVGRMTVAVIALLIFYWWPLVGLFVGPTVARVICGAALALQVIVQSAAALQNRFNVFNGVTGPIGAVILVFAMMRSMVITLRQGGIRWRDSFYPLSELRQFKI